MCQTILNYFNLEGDNRMNKRLVWVDIAKAVGIICVIIGHCLGGRIV